MRKWKTWRHRSHPGWVAEGRFASAVDVPLVAFLAENLREAILDARVIHDIDISERGRYAWDPDERDGTFSFIGGRDIYVLEVEQEKRDIINGIRRTRPGDQGSSIPSK